MIRKLLFLSLYLLNIDLNHSFFVPCLFSKNAHIDMRMNTVQSKMYFNHFLFFFVKHSHVRSILQNWKKTLHIPLRLDIYYEYQTASTPNPNSTTGDGTDNNTGSTTPAMTTRKDLIERWCIDYLPTFEPSNSTHSTNTNSSHYGNSFHSNANPNPNPNSQSQQNQQQRSPGNMDETILQLRQVVKRVIIFLRVLNSLTRLMPGYKLHHALMTEKYQKFQQQQQYQNQQQQQFYNQQQQYNTQNQYNMPYGRRLEGGGPGLRGGYYSQNRYQQQHHQQHQQPYSNQHTYNAQYQQQQAQQSQPLPPHLSEQQEKIGGSIKFLFCVSSSDSNSTSHHHQQHSNTNTNGAALHHNHHQNDLTQQRLFSSTTNQPFARHDLNPIPTPYGILHLTALYDESLNVERVMVDRARRLMEWESLVMNMNINININSAVNRNINAHGMSGGGTDDGPMTSSMTKAIPIQREDENPNQQQQQQQQQNSGAGVVHSYQPQMNTHMQQHRNQTQYNPYHHQNQHQQQNYPQHPMSLPNPTSMSPSTPSRISSPNVVSEHLIQNYARSPVMNKNGMIDERVNGSNKSNNENAIRNINTNSDDKDNVVHQVRDRVGSDPGHGLVRRCSGSKRVLSGLSLALMNDSQEQQKQQQQQAQQYQEQDGMNANTCSGSGSNTPNLSASPLIDSNQIKLNAPSQSPIPPAASSEEAASWKQRVALHHPPPSFDTQQIQYASSASPKNGQMLLQQHQLSSATAHKYGYGYNHGKVNVGGMNSSNVTTSNAAAAIGMGKGGRDCNSPSPLAPLVNTPPQPLFIGSLPRHRGAELGRKAGDDDVKDGGGGEDPAVLSPPFRNPITLQDAPSIEAASSHNGKSLLQQQQSQRQIQTIGASGVLSATSTVQGGRNNSTADNLLLPPLTSMDGLASSPFKFPTPGGGNTNAPTLSNAGSAFSSLSLGKGSAMAFGHDGDGLPLALTSGIFGHGGGAASTGGYASSLGQGRSGSELMFRSNGQFPTGRDDDADDADDMPFAVEMDDDPAGTANQFTAADVSTGGVLKQSTNTDSNLPLSLSSATVSSQIVTSFAHRCATAGRLKLFNSSANVNGQEDANHGGMINNNNKMSGDDKSMASLSSQLAELKSFGESIMSST